MEYKVKKDGVPGILTDPMKCSCDGSVKSILSAPMKCNGDGSVNGSV